MSNVAISVDGIGKRYRLGERQRYRALRDTISDAVFAPFRRLRTGSAVQGHPAYLWALRNVCFDIRQGEIVGIIGPNGAGKSTLLKILSRITEPTTGSARIRGRVGSLLEVGTGFHPELTGRENVYLNGAVLGMRKKEIDRKFDMIVDFADIVRFLDTPVKHYSSGMYVRLAFAVASHLDPEILLVDEVLAVGDARFQRKCLGRMNDVAGEGRTVLVVSHNMGILRELAVRGIWLHDGRVEYDGPVAEAVGRYLQSGAETNEASIDLRDHPNRPAGMKRILTRTCSKNASGGLATDFAQSEDFVLEIEFEAPEGSHLAGVGFNLKTPEGIKVCAFNTYMASPPPHELPARGRARFVTAASQLTPGTYYVSVSLGSHPGSLEDAVDNALRFTVHPSDIYGTGHLLTREDGVTALRVSTSIENATTHANT